MNEVLYCMKDCIIISMFSKTETPYANYYMDSLKKHGKSFDIVYFDRYLNQKKELSNELVFSKYCPTGGNKLKKIVTMIKYFLYINKVASHKKYKRIIVLTTVPGIMLYRKLTKNFCGKYILDIRDYTYEKISIYRLMEKKLIQSSYMTVLSSRGFKKFLPKSDKYVISHNISNQYRKYLQESTDEKKEKKKIGFVGSIRYYDENKRLIDLFSNNKKYQLDYYGTTTNDCELESYVKKTGINNVFFHGAFNNDDKPKIYKNIDIINSIYGIKGLETTTAVPNRFYDAAIYKKPIIVSKGTYLEKLVQKYNLGIAVDIYSNNIFDIIERFIESFDRKNFNLGCMKLLNDVEKDLLKYEECLEYFINYE